VRSPRASSASCAVSAASCTATPPASARGQLERLSELQSQIDAALLSARAFTARELGELRRKRTVLDGYGAGVPAAPARVDSLR